MKRKVARVTANKGPQKITPESKRMVETATRVPAKDTFYTLESGLSSKDVVKKAIGRYERTGRTAAAVVSPSYGGTWHYRHIRETWGSLVSFDFAPKRLKAVGKKAGSPHVSLLVKVGI